MKRLFALALALELVAAQSCTFVHFNGFTKGISVNKERVSDDSWSEEITDFDKIIINVPANCTYTVSDIPAVKVTAPDNLMEHILVRQKNSDVIVEFDDRHVSVGGEDISIAISTKSLKAVEVNGAVDFTAGLMEADDFSCEVNGACQITIDSLKVTGGIDIEVNGAGNLDIPGLDCGNIDLEVNGAGNVTLAGTAGSADISVNGAGEIDVTELRSEDIRTKVSGLGSVKRN